MITALQNTIAENLRLVNPDARDLELIAALKGEETANTVAHAIVIR